MGAADVETHWRHQMTIKSKREVVNALLAVTINPTKRGGSNQFRPDDVILEWKVGK
jgi:hypothetical protein